MGFGLPWALLGLVAAGVPVLIHLMRRRDVRDVRLPTVALLRRARVESRRRMRLVDLLLLACRILLLALLALAVAQPFFHVHLAWGDGTQASAALVVDDSMSMSRVRDGNTLLDRAIERGKEAIEALPEGSEVSVVLAGHPSRIAVRRTSDLEQAVERLDQLPRKTARGTDLRGAVSRATRELSGARHATRRMMVLSDFARHTHADEVRWPASDVKLRAERIGAKAEAPNRTVGEAVAVPDPTTPGRASVRVTVRGFGEKDGAEIPLQLSHRGDEVARADTQLVRGVGRVVMHGPLVDEGDPRGRITLEGDDALAADDTRGVLLRNPTAARVLLVNGDPRASRREDELAFVSKALDAAPRDKGAISYRIVDAATLGDRSLTGVDVAVLANVAAPTQKVAERLTTFVENGGGLLITGGDNVDPRTYEARLDPLLPTHPSPARSGGDEAGLRPPDDGKSAGPLRAAKGLDKVRVQKRLLLEPPGPGADAPLRFSDGSPALVMGKYGEGRTALLATTLDDDWSDLPYRPGYVPLVETLVRELASSATMPDEPFSAGETIELPVPPGAERVRVIGPDGRTHDFEGDALSVPHIPFEETTQAGAYRVQAASETGGLADVPRSAFVVAPPVEESDLSPAPLPSAIAPNEGGPAAGARTVRRPLAPWLFLFAGLIVVAEAALRRRRSS